MPGRLMLACIDDACRGQGPDRKRTRQESGLKPTLPEINTRLLRGAMFQVQYAELYTSSSQD